MLQFFYEKQLEIQTQLKRKVEILPENTLIKGPKYCGKKALIFNFLSNYKDGEFLFLDLKDLRFELKSLENLSNFTLQNPQIKILCLYNLNTSLNLESIKIPIILSTDKKDLKLQNFKELELDYFDFEEFISVNKNLPINHLVGLFFQLGRSKFTQQKLRSTFSELELEILKFLAKNLGKQISTSELFLELKKEFKTSKDTVYKSIKNLENRFFIHSIKHDEKNLKKIYFKDFAFKNAFCIQKDFKHLFENIILSELFKLKSEFFYNRFFNFYSKSLKIGFIASATLDEDLIKLKARKILPKALELGILHIYFITLSSEGSFYEKGVQFEILPFDKWALGL